MEVDVDLCSEDFRTVQRREVATWLRGGLLHYLSYRTCRAVCDRICSHIWPVDMASPSVAGLVGGSMVKGAVNVVQNLIL